MKKRTFLGKLWRGIAKGAVKEIPLVGGLIHNAAEETEDAPKGKIDRNQLIGQLLVAALIIALIAGWIDKETLQYLLGLI